MVQESLDRMSATTRVVAATAAAAALAAWLACRGKKPTPQEPLPDGHSSVSLLHNESSSFMADVPAQTTVTVFNGHASSAAEFLRDRVAAIMRANPWLAGRLQHGEALDQVRHSGHNGLDLVYPIECHAKIASQYFRCVSTRLSRQMSFWELAGALHDAGAFVKVGKQCVGKDEPLFKVCLVEFGSADSFALIVSLSHVIADGHTFYTVHNALSADRKVVALNPQRKMEAPPSIDSALGGPEQALLMSAIPTGFYFFMATRVLASLLLGPPTEFEIYTVDASFVEQQKAAVKAAGDVPFVSTNDVITAAVCKASKTFLAMMAVNFRGRVEQVSDCDAGNYQNVIPYRPRDYQTPALIRASIKPLRRAARPATSIPSFWEFATASTPLMSITNWAQFHEGVRFNGCKEEQHFPIMERPSFVPSRLQSNAVIFNIESGKLGLFVMGSRSLHNAIKASGLVGESPEWPVLR